MHDIIFIGDEVTAAGFRLAGVTSYAPARDTLPTLLAEVAQTSAVIAMTAECAAWLPDRDLAALELADTPLLAIVPDARGAVAAPGMGAAVRRTLGIEV